MTVLCPCCNQAIAGRAPIEALSEGRFPPQMRTIVDVLSKAYPRPVSMGNLIDALYGNDPNGGPDDPEQVIRIRICSLRPQLEQYGWAIPLSTGGPGNYGRYRLAPIGGAS